MQVNLTVNIRDNSVTVIHRVTAIYRAVIHRFDCEAFGEVLVAAVVVVCLSSLIFSLRAIGVFLSIFTSYNRNASSQ